MSNSHNANTGRDYEEHSFGRRLRQFELNRRLYVKPPEPLVLAAQGCETTGDLEVLMPVPDGRLVASLDFQYLPVNPGATWPAGLATSTIRIAACTDLGGGPKPIEYLVGTSTVGARLFPDNCWGFTFSPTEEVECLSALVHFVGPITAGRLVVRGRWQALHPIGEQDWREITEVCSLVLPTVKVLT
jgi:hypothetical protein